MQQCRRKRKIDLCRQTKLIARCGVKTLPQANAFGAFVDVVLARIAHTIIYKCQWKHVCICFCFRFRFCLRLFPFSFPFVCCLCCICIWVCVSICVCDCDSICGCVGDVVYVCAKSAKSPSPAQRRGGKQSTHDRTGNWVDFCASVDKNFYSKAMSSSFVNKVKVAPGCWLSALQTEEYTTKHTE